MATVSVRYIVDDVDAAIAFYCGRLGFTELMHPGPQFAMLCRGDLRLVLSASDGGPGGGQAMPDGTAPEPGGWNRFSVEVDDLDEAVGGLRSVGAHLRNAIVDGVGGRQVIVDDPSGNPVELFEPTREEARLEVPDAGQGRERRDRTNGPDGSGGSGGPDGSFEVRPIGRVESSLVDLADAPNQGTQGAPDAWLVIDPDVREGIRDLTVGSDLYVLTWLHHSRRDELSTTPGDDPGGPERGVFSTRSPARPNPVGLHRVTVLELGDGRVRVGPLEAIHGTPVVDIKPVIASDLSTRC